VININDYKLLPTVNFIDPFTLKSWGEMRKIFLDYSKEYSTRIAVFLPSIVGILCFFTAMEVCIYKNGVDEEKDELLRIGYVIFVFDVLPLILFSIKLFIGCA
jgi:hypothetical protein